MADKLKPRRTTPVRQHRFDGDERSNIPTAELESFVRDEDKRPTIVRYPRNPDLDPQLVWKGKDEQDSHDLEVPAVPIYIQETIDPLALIEELRAESEGRRTEQQLGFFGPYSDLPFEEKVDFYRHAGKWTNRMILGDSLLVMTSLAEKEGLKGQVQTIYIDPPYGIKFGSNWQVSTRKRDVRDGKDTDLTRQPEQVRAYRDTWELGIHSYLAYLRDRLVAARELLTESGSVFVQIGDENVHLVRSILDEVLGASNFVLTITFAKTSYATANEIPVVADYLVWYAKSREHVKFRRLFQERSTPGVLSKGEDEDFQSRDLASAGPGASTFEFPFDGKTYHPGVNRHWKTNREGLDRVAAAGRLFAARNSLRYRRLLTDFPLSEFTNLWTDTIVGSFLEDKLYVVQTSPKVVARCLLMTTDPGDLVLDPTCGSGTTAYVAEQWGRRWITADTSRVALALARSRLMAGKFPYYLLADSEAGIRKEAELIGSRAMSIATPTNDVRRGFVYERVPHVTLKSIAQNPDIGGDEVMKVLGV